MPRVHVVAHTHWDREWYHTAATFQARLARLMDGLLDLLERRADLPTFLLDGQAVTLDDFLARRPARAGLLARLLAEQRLECGPWYVLPDELLVSAEALVRNLLIGGQAVRRSGGQPMRVGYTPDAFGHSGALPLILRGFDIPTAVLWRGFGGEPGQEGDLYRWRAADGSEVLLVHLPRPGYEYGANLPADAAEARARWGRLASLLAPRARTEHWLVPAGADHHAPPPDLPDAVEALREASGADVRLGTLEGYADAVAAAARALDLPLVAGELRGGRRHAWALQGTHGARPALKRWNAHCQRLLERAAEPLAALAHARAGADLRAELEAAWRQLLENHPHDSICGTSADPVHREMLVRFERCRAMALETAHYALDLVTGRDAAAARVAGRGRWRPTLFVFNPSPRPFGGVVEAEVALFQADVGVGVGSRALTPRVTGRAFAVSDGAGRAVPCQVLGRRAGHDLSESPRHYPDCDAVEWVRVALRPRELPALGVVPFAVAEPGGPAAAAEPPDEPVRVGPTTLENAHLLVRVEAAGTLEVVDFATGEHYRGVGGLETQADRGDSYTSSPRGAARILAPDEVAAAVVHQGPLRGTLEIRRRFERWDLDVLTAVSLDAGARAVTLWLRGVNARTDHRLRAVVPLGTRARRVVADGHFGPVERTGSRMTGMRPGDLEAAAPTAPMQRGVTAAAGPRGLTVFADGLPEYEVSGEGRVLVTLLRAFGELSRADLPERPGHAGWPTSTPDAQCLGPFAARLAVMPHPEGALLSPGAVECEAERFHAAPFARMVRAVLERPAAVAGPELVGEGLVASACKPAEDGRGVVLRCYNATGARVFGAWLVPWAFAAARLCRLDETELEPIGVAGGRVPFEAGPRGVVTIRIR